MRVVTKFNNTYTSPSGGGTAFDSGGFSSDSTSSSGGGPTGTFLNTAKFSNWESTNLNGFGPNDIQKITGVLDWSASGNADASVDSDGSASAGSSATADIFCGGSGSNGFFLDCGVSVNGPGPVNDSDSFSDGGQVTAVMTPNTTSNLNSVQCTGSIDGSAESGISGSTGSSSCDSSISITPSVNVLLSDWRIMAT